MKPKSAKAKGRNLQNLVRDKILEFFPFLVNEDVKTAIMGEKGSDIKLSPFASNIFPYNVECKSRESFSIYNMFAQANSHHYLEPLLVIKQNHAQPLAIIRLDHFLELAKTYEKHNGT